jgi:aminopeptidase N
MLFKETIFPLSEEELLFQLGHDDAVGRMEAAGRLAGRAADRQVAAALKRSAAEDPFWAVRRSALEALAQAQTGEWTVFFKERALDPNSSVRAAALRALGDRLDKALVPFFQERFKGEDSYVAQAECLTALGKCGEPAAIGFLNKAAAMPSPRGMLKRAAEAALKSLQGAASGRRDGTF